MPKYTIEAPDGRKLTVEADDEGSAISGVQQWVQQNPADPKAQAEVDVRAGKDPDYRQPGMLPAGLQRFSDAMTDPFGVQDEMVGFGQGVRAFVGGGGDWDAAKKAYSDAAERVRAERRVAREDYGIVPEIIGGLGTSAAAKGFKMAPTFLGRVGQSGKAGAGYGVAAGVAQGEGGVGERLASGAEGAAVGAVLGPAISEVAAPAIGAIARGTKAGASGLKGAVQAVRGVGANTDARMARALAQQDMTPRQAIRRVDEAQAAAKFGKTQLDPRFVPADLGPVTRDLADTAALVSKEARGESGAFLTDRARSQFARMNDYVRRGLQVARGDFAKAKEKLVGEQKTLSNKAYKAAFADKNEYDVGQVLFDNQLDAQNTAGPLAEALNRARSFFVDPSRGPGFQARLTTERFDSGKRALDDMIQTAKQGGKNNEARMLTELKHNLLGVIDKANPNYQAARDVYSSRADLLDALDAGRAFMKGDAEMTGAQYGKLSTAEKRMFRVGIAREVRKTLGSRTLNSDALGYFDKPNTRAVLEEIMTPSQFQKFYQLVDLEQALAATNAAVRGNSKTAQRQQDVADFSLSVRLGRAVKDRGLRDALVNEVFDGVTRAMAMREGDATALTRMLFETDPAAQRAMFQRLQQTYGKKIGPIVDRAQRIALGKIATARRTLAGVAGEQADEFSGQRSP